jgi:Flp pilus assembly protein TadG
MRAQTPNRLSRRQSGAVAIMFGIVAFILFGFMAVVIDLGRTYVVRTELQNAADASALAGARQLDQTAAGVTRGVAHAIAMAAQNNVQFSRPVAITIANISVGSCPDDGCMVPAATVGTNAAASGMTFMRVNIDSGGLATFFARIPFIAGGEGTDTMTTFGRAVAGRFVNNITPIAVCGMNTDRGRVLPTGELSQFGFRRGVSYNIFELGPVGSPANPYLLNPVDTYPNGCTPSNSSSNFVAPFICTGTSAVLASNAERVYGNTGMEARIAASLNSRFNDYGPPSVCIPEQAPPDSNVREFRYQASPASRSATWMSPTQSRQTYNQPWLATAPTAANHGVLWSYSRAVRGVGTSPNATPGAPYSTSDWGTLYNGVTANASFPASGSPYESAGFTLTPTGRAGQADRRVLSLVIANCTAVVGSGNCTQIPVLGIGRFFMQIPADFTGGPNRGLWVEFAGLVEPIPTAEIKLYR